MAVDNKIPTGEPGVAGFAMESWGNIGDVRYGDGELTTTELTITASGADIDLALYSVINGGGTLADYNATPDAGTADYVLAEPIFIADGDTMTVPVYREGHFNMDALVWDATYDTDAKKAAAFEGSVSPTIFVSKPKHNSDAIY